MLATGGHLLLTNLGTIDPSGRSNMPVLTSGLIAGNGSASSIIIQNGPNGIFRGTAGAPTSSLTTFAGMAVESWNAVGGQTRIHNAGLIESRDISGLSTPTLAADKAVMAILGGGQVIMSNAVGGRIIGRIAFERSSGLGNTFLNAGSIQGSVSMGAGGLNEFTAVTSGTLSGGGSTTGSLGNTLGYNLVFAPTGQVDGGAGGINTLKLRNPAGTGSSEASTINASQYVNFNKLEVSSGTWTINGALLASYDASTTLQGGTAVVDNSLVFGNGRVTANGGTLQSNADNLNLASAISLGSSGLTVSGSKDLTLSGMITGTGGTLRQGGSGALTLTRSNSYDGMTYLDSGKLILGNDSALGSGPLFVGGGTLESSQAVVVRNGISVSSPAMTVAGSNDITLAGLVSFGAKLIKNGTSNLTLGSSTIFSGGAELNSGNLTIGSGSAFGGGSLTVSGESSLATSQSTTLQNNIALDSKLTVSGSEDLQLAGTISGWGKLIKTGSGKLTLSAYNTYGGGVELRGGTLSPGQASLGSGELWIKGDSSLEILTSLTHPGAVTVDAELRLVQTSNLVLDGVLSGSGTIVKTGASTLGLNNSNNTFNGTYKAQQGVLTNSSTNALGTSPNVNLASGAELNMSASATVGQLTGLGSAVISATSLLTLGGNDQTSTFAGAFSGGGGLVKAGSGTLTLSNTSSHSGNTQIKGGTLNLSGRFSSSTVTVNSGGSLRSTGQLDGGVVVSSGGALALAGGTAGGVQVQTGGSLLVNAGSPVTTGELFLGSGSILTVGLGQISTTPIINVQGNLTLDGITLNLLDAGDISNGVHRLMNYTGTLSYGGHILGSLPTGVLKENLFLSPGAGQVNLVVSSPLLPMQFWDGNNITASGMIDGGRGTWNGNLGNWTNATGSNNWAWASQGAVFQGAAGTVSVEGAQSVSFMQFMTDGYSVVSGSNGSLSLSPGETNSTQVRVDHGVRATLGLALVGASRMDKVGSGTLVLTGNNAYFGGTQLMGGSLLLGHASALGSGPVKVLTGTTLGTTTALSLSNSIDFSGASTLDVSQDLTLTGALSGSGSVTKTGAGTLTLSSASSSLSEALTLSEGALVLTRTRALGSAALIANNNTSLSTTGTLNLGNAVTVNGTLTLPSDHDLGLSGVISGAGTLIKQGNSTLTLSGNNQLTGTLRLDSGTLSLSNDGALGQGTLQVAGVSTLGSDSGLTLGNAVILDAQLSLPGDQDLTLNGVVSGVNGLVKNGAATLTLNSTNLHQGETRLHAGKLIAGRSGALGDGLLNVAGSGTLEASSTVTLNNAVDLSGALTVSGSNALTLSGGIHGSGSLTKAGSGILTLSGSSSLLGNTTISGGTLRVDGSLGNGRVSVEDGAVLTGRGTVGGAVTVANEGRLGLTGGSVLTLGSLVLNANSHVDVAIGLAVPGTAGLANVTGNLTLDGTLNITDTGGFGLGVYRLFDYDGMLVDNGLQFGVLPTGIPANELHLQTSVGKQFNLVVGNSQNLRFWDGSGLSGNGSVDGGSGTWNSTLSNWTTSNAAVNGIWNSSFALFQGPAGTVTVEGTQSANGLQFGSNYTLVGGSAGEIQLINGINGYTTVRVDSRVTATLDVSLGGSGLLNKLDTGTLILNGTNTYSGGTQLSGGILSVSSDANLGSAGSALTLNGGTLRITGTGFVNNGSRTWALGNAGGTIDIADSSNSFAMANAWSGSGSLTKQGSGTLVLTGAHTYTGSTTVGAGALELIHGGSLQGGEGMINSSSGPASRVTLNGAHSRWEMGSNSLYVGNDGQGLLQVQGGAKVNSRGGYLGSSMGGIGQAQISGNGSAWDTQQDLALGLLGEGHLSIDQGGRVTAPTIQLGSSSIGRATLTVSGDAAQGRGVLETRALQAGDGSVDITLNGGILRASARNMHFVQGSLSPVHIALGAEGGFIDSNGHDIGAAAQFTGSGALIKQGAGTLTLTAASSYAGGSHIEAGSLAIGASGSLNTAGAVNLTGIGAGFDISGSGAHQTVGALAGIAGTTVALGSQTLSFGNAGSQTFAGQITGSGGIQKQGTGTAILAGDNHYSGATTIAAGTVQVGNGGQAGSLGSGAVVNHGALTFERSGSLVVAGDISGQGSLTQSGSGTVTLAGNASYSGRTQVTSGTLNFAGGSTVLAGNVDVAASAGLGIGGGSNSSVTVAGHVNLGSGANLSINSPSTGPQLSASGLNIGSGVGLNISGIHTESDLDRVLISTAQGITGDFSAVTVGGFAGPVDYMTLTTGKSADGKQYLARYSLNWFANNHQRVDASGSFTLTHASQRFDVGTALTDQASNPLKGWDGQSLTKNGDGTLVLSTNNSYSGTTSINGGTLQIGNGATQGTLGLGSVTNHGTLAIDRSDTLILSQNISGTGSLHQLGTGTTTLTGSNSYTGATQIAAGTLQVGDGGTTGNLSSSPISNNGRLAINRSDTVTLDQDISGSGGLGQLGTGTTVLTGSNSYTGATQIAAGTLQAGSASALAQNSAYVIEQGATLDLNNHALQTTKLSGAGTVLLGAANLTVNTAAGQADQLSGQVSGTGHVVKQGDGILALNGASSFTGGVQLKQGAISLGHEQGLGTGTLAMDDNTRIVLSASGMTIANALHMTGNNDPIVDTGSNHTTWAGAITGAGLLTKQGWGTLTLTSAANTYTGATDVAQGMLQAGAANTLSSTSAHTVASGAVLDLAGYSQTLASLNNSGTVALSSHRGAAPGTVLKVTGAYVGSNGNLDLSTVLGADGSAADKLLLSGASAVASGNTTVHITNAGGLGAQTTGDGIGIISTENGASLQPGSFSLAGGHVDAGAYEYRLKQTTQGAALHSTASATPATAYREQVPLLSALPAQLRQADMAMLGDLRKRMGDEGTQATTRTDAGASRRVWGRILRTDPKISQQGTASPQSSGHLTGFQAGLDLYAHQGVKAGIYVGQLDGDMSVKGFVSGVEHKYAGLNTLRNRYLGVYGSWQDASGLYADAVLQAADYRSDLRTASTAAQARTKGSGWLASVEMGKAFAVSSHWQIEPQAQLSYRKLSLDDTALSLATVKNRADDDWTVRLGARIKGQFATSAGVLQPYGGISLHKTSSVHDIASFVAPGASSDIQAKSGYTSTELAAGSSLQISPSTSIYGELGKLWAHGGDSRVKSGVQASIGLKVLW